MNRIDTNITFKEFKDRNFKELTDELYAKHKERFHGDYTYIGNLQFDFEYFINLEKTKKTFYFSNNPEEEKRRETFKNNNLVSVWASDHDEKFDVVQQYLELKFVNWASQYLPAGHLIGLHHDVNYKTIYNPLSELRNIDNDYIDDINNIYIVFLQDWQMGQVFMIGRDCVTQWRAGDIISFPWYMAHATANASLKDRHILYMAGSKI